ALPAQLVGRDQDSGDAFISVRVTVTDPAGQKQTKAVSRNVTPHQLRIELIPEAGSLVQGIANQVFLFATSGDGSPVKDLKVEILGMEKGLRTRELGVASFDITPHSNTVELTIQSDSPGKGPPFMVRRRLVCGQSHLDFLVRTDKAVYDGGETIHLTALAGG